MPVLKKSQIFIFNMMGGKKFQNCVSRNKQTSNPEYYKLSYLPSQIVNHGNLLNKKKLQILSFQHFNNFNQQLMQKKSLNWDQKEEQLLRAIKQQQIFHNRKDWVIIAKTINEKFKTNKTPKHCRERYVNHLKFSERSQICIQWTQQQLDLLFQLYTIYGSSWARISRFIPNKSQNSIKNKFNNCLKIATKNIQQCMLALKVPRRKKINIELLSTLIDMANKIRKLAGSLRLTINQDSMIFKFQRNILALCLDSQKIPGQKLQELVSLIRAINNKLRCFGLFKASNKKSWKMTLKNLRMICQFDKVVFEELSSAIEQQGAEDQEKKQQQMLSMLSSDQKKHSSIQNLVNQKTFLSTDELADQIRLQIETYSMPANFYLSNFDVECFFNF